MKKRYKSLVIEFCDECKHSSIKYGDPGMTCHFKSAEGRRIPDPAKNTDFPMTPIPAFCPLEDA